MSSLDPDIVWAAAYVALKRTMTLLMSSPRVPNQRERDDCAFKPCGPRKVITAPKNLSDHFAAAIPACSKAKLRSHAAWVVRW